MPRPFSLRYVNASGQTIDFDSWPFFWDDTSLQNYSWDTKTSAKASGYGSTISKLSKSVISKNIKLLVYNSGANVDALLDDLSAKFEADVIKQTPGKLYFNSQYLAGYFTGFSVSKRKDKTFLELALTFTSGSPFWITEELHTFLPSSTGSSTGFIFPMAFPFGFASPDVRSLINDHYGDCSAKITFYGPCTDPEINLGPNTYKVFGELLTGERFEIDQVAMTVTKITAGGERLNFLYARGKTKSVFDRIPAGESFITATDFTFEILLYKERSEPKWS